MSKEETGVMVMKDGKAWGKTYEDGHSTYYGWMDAESAPIHNPKYCTKPTDLTYEGSHYTEELMKGVIVSVKRVTTVTVT